MTGTIAKREQKARTTSSTERWNCMLHMEVAREVPMRVVTERCERKLPMRAELEVGNERCK